MLRSLDLTPQQTVSLDGNERRRLLNFLLRWEAFEDLHACLDLLNPRNPTLVSLRDARARALLAEGRPEEALPVMEERIQQKESSVAHGLLARVWLALDDVAAAREIAQTLLAERPESAAAWSLLGEVELTGGDEQAALAAYRRLHELYPNSRAYLWGMSSVHASSGDWVTASAYAVQLLRLAEEGSPLSVGYVRRLHGFFQASGESPRAAELEDQLARRRIEELAQLREALLEGAPASARQSTSPRAKSTALPGATPGRAGGPVPAELVDRLPSYETVSVSDAERCAIGDAVRQLFGFDSLLPGQLETVACVLRGEDVLTVLPTGGGKSLCYQLPALVPALAMDDPTPSTPGGESGQGLTLVISPPVSYTHLTLPTN